MKCFVISDFFPEIIYYIVDQLLSCVRLFVSPWTVACQASLSFTTSQSLLKLKSIEVSDAIQLSRLLSSSSPAFNLPQHQSLF